MLVFSSSPSSWHAVFTWSEQNKLTHLTIFVARRSFSRRDFIG